MDSSDYTDLKDVPHEEFMALQAGLNAVLLPCVFGNTRTTDLQRLPLTVNEGVEAALEELNTPMEPCDVMEARMTTLVDGEPVTIIVTEGA